MRPGEILTGEGTVTINQGKKAVSVKVENAGDRPVQVGSHFHFFEVNERLKFDRKKAYGKRLDIPAGTSVRFQPGECKTVELIDMGGRGRVHGANGLVNGYLEEKKDGAISRVKEK